ncbi:MULTISPECIES: TetR/AcrR family transcriptional regulator [unclassified Amycolatopsis]|uniref:TetR/AcrR family transcriptional regulator n=1 Tax=unclassified Amycolatopsis TaxID=2618356 RepID=UPI001FF67AA1|nr:TetR/AcrR family transcriptional regulator [Amycolatopsis sp. FBCC-B4732]UOX86350.1 TetR/AcrR family transcriptional regulator [Amycolatopsis sp. FBCC-B4732]
MSPRKAAAQKDGQSLHDLLVEAAEKLIATRGTTGLTVREIARTAGVADGVLYNHFSDKEELVAWGLDRHVRAAESFLGELPVAGEGTVAENLHRHLEYGLGLHRVIVPAFSGLYGNPEVLQRFADLGERPGHWRDRLLAYLKEEQALGRLHPESEVDAAAALLVGYCHETVLGTIFPHASRTNPPEPAAVIRTILNGIAP